MCVYAFVCLTLLLCLLVCKPCLSVYSCSDGFQVLAPDPNFVRQDIFWLAVLLCSQKVNINKHVAEIPSLDWDSGYGHPDQSSGN